MIQIPITNILFPNRCEVIELKDQHLNIFVIYKNGSSSLYAHAAQTGSKILVNNQIKRLESIDVVFRNPQDRFISGVNTYAYNIKRDNPQLDLDTIIFFVKNYLFLNRHYLPQIGWLVNLSRYLDDDIPLRLHSMSELSDIAPNIIKPSEEFILTDEVVADLKSIIDNELYLNLDNLLLSLAGQQLTMNQIFTHLKTKDPLSFQKVIS